MYYESIWIAYEHIKDQLSASQLSVDLSDHHNLQMDWGLLLPLARVCVRYVVHGYIRRSFGTINRTNLPEYCRNERHVVIEEMKENSRNAWYLCYLYAHELVCDKTNIFYKQ